MGQTLTNAALADDPWEQPRGFLSPKIVDPDSSTRETRGLTP